MESIARLAAIGIAYHDAIKLRRISMTLHRWHELECGDGNDHGSWCIVRGRKETRHGQHAGGHGAHYVFLRDDDGKPYMEHHRYMHGQGKDSVSYTAIPDSERGALKRLGKIMASYPGFVSYVQGDPRGCALYILPPDLVARSNGDIGSIYSGGVAVCK